MAGTSANLGFVITKLICFQQRAQDCFFPRPRMQATIVIPQRAGVSHFGWARTRPTSILSQGKAKAAASGRTPNDPDDGQS